ncbi:hypothetical protein [Comamonas aquatica]|uniref:hypothetical protein n=1 Tax=Comamonas aquatica TaxID=225991 RepID=UPI0012DFE327|nr:hypothetical protein [Comamonas aquatica]
MTDPETNDLKGERFSAQASVKQMYAEKWIDISLDTDRQLLTLSTAAIGVLAAFITTKGVSSVLQLLIIFASVSCFVAVIAGLLYVFKLNRNFLALQSSGGTPDESLMMFLDKAIRILFFIGIFGTSTYALSIAISDVEKNTASNRGVTSESKNRSSEELGRPVSSDRKLSGSDSVEYQRKSGRDEQPDTGSGSPIHKHNSSIKPAATGEPAPILE